MAGRSEQPAPKCASCGSDLGYFSDATYSAVLLHSWDGKPLHDISKMNMVYREHNFRCAKCKAPVGTSRKPRMSDVNWESK